MRDRYISVHPNPGTWLASHHTRTGCFRRKLLKRPAIRASHRSKHRDPESVARLAFHIDSEAAGCRIGGSRGVMGLRHIGRRRRSKLQTSKAEGHVDAPPVPGGVPLRRTPVFCVPREVRSNYSLACASDMGYDVHYICIFDVNPNGECIQMAIRDGGVALVEAPETAAREPGRQLGGAHRGVALNHAPEIAASPEEKGEKRLNLVLSAGVYGDLSRMAKQRHTTMTEIVRLALGLIKVVIHETDQGNKLVVAKADGQALKELILPG